jgi:replicative DNA helicase
VADGSSLAPSPGRVPPASLDAEAACLSAALLDPDSALELADLLTVPEFYSDSNRWIFEVIVGLLNASRKVDIISVANELKSSGRIDQVGGTSYLAQLADATPAVANLREHARIVRNCARLRRVISECQRIAAEGYGTQIGNADSFLEDCESRVYLATADRHTSSDSVGYRELARETYAAIVAAYDDPDAVRKVERRTGFHKLDEQIGCMVGGDLVVVAGRPGQGKSSLAHQIAETVAGDNWAVPFLSLEMKRKQLMLRTIARRSGTRALQLRRGKSENWPAVTAAVAELAELPMRVDDCVNLTALRGRAKARRMYADIRREFPGIGFGLVVVDYLQLMGFDDLPGTENELRAVKIGNITRAWKTFAMEFDVPVMLLSQLNRPKKDGSKVPRPTLTDLRDSGRIEEDADTVIFIHREDQHDAGKQEKNGEGELIVAKCRSGEGEGIHKVKFDGSRTLFYEEQGSFF